MNREQRICWGCDLPILDQLDRDYCSACRIGLELIRKWQDEGLRVHWVIPEQAIVHCEILEEQ